MPIPALAPVMSAHLPSQGYIPPSDEILQDADV
jgi:hypothetical protein